MLKVNTCPWQWKFHVMHLHALQNKLMACIAHHIIQHLSRTARCAWVKAQKVENQTVESDSHSFRSVFKTSWPFQYLCNMICTCWGVDCINRFVLLSWRCRHCEGKGFILPSIRLVDVKHVANICKCCTKLAASLSDVLVIEIVMLSNTFVYPAVHSWVPSSFSP